MKRRAILLGIAAALFRASVLAGGPHAQGGELRYANMPTVGQAVVLFGKAALLAERESSRGKTPMDEDQR